MFSNRGGAIIPIELYRDGADSPWGFRLKGGIDVDGGTPLEIVKVFVGSASEGVLFPGDRVVSINHQDTSRLTHLEAQNLIKNAGTSARVDVIRPGAQAPKRGSLPGMTSSAGFFQPMEGQEQFEREYEMAKVHSQPFRTRQLVFPGAKTVHEHAATTAAPTAATAAVNREAPAHGALFAKHQPKVAAAQTVVDAICHKQPYRTTPLVTPAPRTINDVTANRVCSSPVPFKPVPFHQSNSHSPGNATVKTINIGGTPKQLVNNQFNSPIGLYSEDAIADSVVTNPAIVQANCPTLGQIQQHQHPGYVQSSKPHLPHPKDATFSRPQASETFKIILESEMDKARDQKGVTGSEFTKQAHFDRPSSSASNKASNVDPVMMDKSINQSASFKRIMYSVLDADDY